MITNINVCFCVDKYYLTALTVAITSLIENLEDNCRLKIFVIHDNVNDIEITLNTFKSMDKVSFEAINVGIYRKALNLNCQRMIEGLNTSYFTDSIFFRLYLGYLLPKDISRVIYLDADTLLTSAGILKLWQVDLSGKVIGAVAEAFTAQDPIDMRYKHKIELGYTGYYFNSGVLLIDLDQYRKYDMLSLSASLIQNKHLIFPDQDILNVIFSDYQMLEPKFNSMWASGSPLGLGYLHYLKLFGQSSPYSESMVRTSINEPCIIHYISRNKPWLIPGQFYLHKQTWWSYYNKSELRTEDSLAVEQLLTKEYGEFVKKNNIT